MPGFVMSGKFEFKKFIKIANYSIAQSLFTHLNYKDIKRCMERLREYVKKTHRFYATFCEMASIKKRLFFYRSHSHRCFAYTREQMQQVGIKCSFKPRYIGDWNHHRRRKVIEYIAV